MLSILLPVLLAAPLEPQQPGTAAQTSTELLPLQQLCSREDEELAPSWRSLLRYVPRHNRTANLVIASDGSGAITADGIFDVLQTIEEEALDEGHLSLTPVGDNLLAFGEAERVRGVVKRIDEATQILARPLQIEFAVWDATSRETPAAVLTAEDYQRFAANRQPMWRSIAAGRAGHAVTLRNMTWTRYVRTLEVEVAQKQTMSRPETERFAEGAHAAVRAHPLIDSDEFALHVQFVAGRPRGVLRSIQTGLPGAADIELPRLETSFGACSGRIQNGGALAVTLRGHASGGGQLILTMRAVSPQPPAELSDERTALLPVGAITSGALTQTASVPNLFEHEEEAIDYEREGIYGRIPPDQLVQLAESIIDATDQDSPWMVRFADDHLFVMAAPTSVRQIKAAIRRLQDQTVRNVQLQHVALLGPQQQDDGGRLDGPLLHELTLPTLLGREFAAVRIHETNVLAHVHVEIATEAGILAPGLDVLQSGAWLRGRAIPGVGGMHLDLDLQVADAPIPPMRSVMPGGGVLMPTTITTTRRKHDGFVANGQTIDHGDGPTVLIEGRGYSSTLSTTLRR